MLDASSIKTGRIYVQIVQRRLGRVSVVYHHHYFFFQFLLFFFSEDSSIFFKLSSTFMRPVFTPVDFNISDVKYV